MKVIDQINGSALFAQSAFSASIATKDSLGRDITATYLTGIDLSNYYTKDETSGAEQLAQAFSDIPGGSVSSKYGTITVDGNDIEATNKAIEYKGAGFTSSFDGVFVSYENPPVILTWDEYSQETRIFVQVYNGASEDSTLTYSSNTNVTGEFTTGGYESYDFGVQIPNATAIQFSSDNFSTLQHVGVSAPSSYRVSELAWKSDLPTYTYNSANKLSAINGSALVGNEDYLVKQGFVQNLKSPKGTIYVLNNNKIECTNSAIASDVIEGFVSAYNDKNTFPGYSATLTWDRYVHNTKLFVSGAEYAEHTLTYSADTGVTGTITVQADGQASIELPTNSTSIVIGNENLDVPTYNFTVSAADSYEIGELAWASAIPTYEYDSTNKISAINGSALAGQGGGTFDATYMSAQIDNKLNKSEIGFRKVNSIDYVSGISGKNISAKFAYRANTAYNADHANTASYDDNGNSLTTTYYNAQEANNKANDLFNFVQSNSSNWGGGSSTAGESVLFHCYQSYDPINGSQNNESFVSGATELYFEAAVDSQQGTPSDIVITRNGNEIGRAYWSQVSSDGSNNYLTASYNNADGGDIQIQNYNNTNYNWCKVSANGVKTQSFYQDSFDCATDKEVKFNVNGFNIVGQINGLFPGNITPLTSFTGGLTDFTAKGYNEYDIIINSEDSNNSHNYNLSAEFGEGGSSVTSGDVFPPTNNLEPQTTYYLGWNANNGGLFWYHP